MKGIYRRFFAILALVILAVFLNTYLSGNTAHINNYVNYIFLPIQRGKNSIFNLTSFSIGDYIYLLLAFYLLLMVIRLIYYAFTILKNKIDFITEALRIALFAIIIYLIFFISWGGNYYRPNLASQWKANVENNWNQQALIQLNEFLLQHLNELSRDSIEYPNLKLLNKEANNLYHRYFCEELPTLKVKPTSLGYLLNYIGVHGYYNPLSGEGQFNKALPPFMQPFVVTHEMAHQAGIAAEDDANLLAYLIGIKSNRPAFQYSAYFNVFLYAYGNLEMEDSATAKKIWYALNPVTKRDYEALATLYRRYKSIFRGVSNSVYNDYLKWNGQQKGLNSYDVVTRWVYYWEFDLKEKADLKICPSN